MYVMYAMFQITQKLRACSKQLGIPKFINIMPIQLCKFMYAYTNGNLPVTLINIFVMNT